MKKLLISTLTVTATFLFLTLSASCSLLSDDSFQDDASTPAYTSASTGVGNSSSQAKKSAKNSKEQAQAGTNVTAAVHKKYNEYGRWDGTCYFESDLESRFDYYILSKDDGSSFSILNVEYL